MLYATVTADTRGLLVEKKFKVEILFGKSKANFNSDYEKRDKISTKAVKIPLKNFISGTFGLKLEY